MKKKQRNELVTEFLGWVGVLLILLAYALLSLEVISSQSMWYHGLNLFGGVGIIVDAVADKNYQPAALNVVWILIAIYGISRTFL